MKKLIAIILFSLFITFQSFAQNSQCPSISVSGPMKSVRYGETMTFTAEVKGENLGKIEYKWQVSNGTIFSGQGTNALVVATTEEMAGQTVTATIEIIGLSKDCQNEFSATSEIEAKPVISCGLILPAHEYKKISFNREKQKLEHSNSFLQNEKDSFLLILIEVTSKDNLLLLKNRITNIEKYLIESLKIPKEKFSIFVSKSKTYQTLIYLLPHNYDFYHPKNPINLDEEIKKLSLKKSIPKSKSVIP